MGLIVIYRNGKPYQLLACVSVLFAASSVHLASSGLLAQATLGRVEEAVIETERATQCGSRYVAVYRSGVLHVTYVDTCGRKEGQHSMLQTVSTQIVASLEKIVSDADFAEITHDLVPPSVITDEDVLSIVQRKNGEVHRVRASGLDRLNSDEARRFQRIWAAVEEFVQRPR